MKKVISAVVAIAVALSLSACARPLEVCGVTYQSYGLLNADDKKNEGVEYEVVWGNLVWSVVLMETIVAPIYFFGFSIFQPVGPKAKVKGAVGTHNDCERKS